MAEHPCFPLWTDAYLADAGHLTTVEHGAYLLLLITMWRTSDKSLPNDDKMLARYTRLTAGQWRRIKPTIMNFFEAENGQLRQGRLTDEANAVRQHRVKQSDKAKARWLKNKKPPHAVAMPEPCQSDAPLPLPLTKEESKEERKKDIYSSKPPKISEAEIIELCQIPSSLDRRKPKPPSLDEQFTSFWQAYPKKVGKGQARKAWRAACKKADPANIIADVTTRQWPGETQFIPYPTTYLNGERWLDEPDAEVEGSMVKAVRGAAELLNEWDEADGQEQNVAGACQVESGHEVKTGGHARLGAKVRGNGGWAGKPT